MKGALLVAHPRDFFDLVADALTAAQAPPRQRGPGYARLTDAQGRHFTLLDEAEPHYMSEFRTETLEWEPLVQPFDVQAVTGVVAECRWEDMFIDVVARTAETLGFQIWVVDGNGHVWRAEAIDVARLQL